MYHSINLRCAEKGTVDGGTGEIKAREATFGGIRPVSPDQKEIEGRSLPLARDL
jgi:hypothetical protein